MKWSKWLENWDMSKLKFSAPFLEMEWQPQTADKDAAWDLYVELLTRITTQPLPDEDGDEAAALESVHQLFGLTREILHRYGRDSMEFTKLAIVILNQIVRPFTASWHKLSLAGAFRDADQRRTFRVELRELQEDLTRYMGMLGQMAGVKDLRDLT